MLLNLDKGREIVLESLEGVLHGLGLSRFEGARGSKTLCGIQSEADICAVTDVEVGRT